MRNSLTCLRKELLYTNQRDASGSLLDMYTERRHLVNSHQIGFPSFSSAERSIKRPDDQYQLFICVSPSFSCGQQRKHTHTVTRKQKIEFAFPRFGHQTRRESEARFQETNQFEANEDRVNISYTIELDILRREKKIFDKSGTVRFLQQWNSDLVASV